MGSCVAACKSDAIHINSFGAAEVDRGNCGLRPVRESLSPLV